MIPPASARSVAWVGGIAGTTLLASAALPASARYLALVLGAPLLAASLSGARAGSRGIEGVRSALAWAGAVFAALAVLRYAESTTLIVGALHGAAWVLGVRRRSVVAPTWREEAPKFFAAVLAWTAVAPLVWWMPFGDWLLTYTGCALVLAVSVGVALLRPVAAPPRRGSVLGVAAIIAAAAVALAFRDPWEPLATATLHHWSAIVGPAQLLRQGGHWLLWDVPFQYGFLATLSVAFLPLPTTWLSLYAINAALTAASAGLLTWLWAGPRPSPRRLGAAGVAAIAATLLFAGWAPEVAGPAVAPSAGAFRYFWAWWLFALLHRQVERPEPHPSEGGVGTGPVLAAWAIGAFWSFESLALCASVLLPHAALRGGRSDRLRLAAVPVLGWAAIELFYRVRLGHGPDPAAWIEYALAFGSGRLSEPIREGGAVSFALGVGVILVAALVETRRERRWFAGAFSAFGLFAATQLYFLARAHDNNQCNLAASSLLALTLPAAWAARPQASGSLRMSVRAFLVASVALIAAAGWGQVRRVAQRLGDLPGLRENLVRGGLGPELPEAARSLLAAEAGLDARSPLLALDDPNPDLLGRWVGADGREVTQTRAWSPIFPLSLFSPLPDARRRLYLDRFFAAEAGGGGGGWTLSRDRGPRRPEVDAVRADLDRTHRVTRVLRDATGEFRLEFRAPLVGKGEP